jgi:hypothetical protein
MMIWRGIFAALMLSVVLASAHTHAAAVAAPAAEVAAR